MVVLIGETVGIVLLLLARILEYHFAFFLAVLPVSQGSSEFELHVSSLRVVRFDELGLAGSVFFDFFLFSRKTDGRFR